MAEEQHNQDKDSMNIMLIMMGMMWGKKCLPAHHLHQQRKGLTGTNCDSLPWTNGG